MSEESSVPTLRQTFDKLKKMIQRNVQKLLGRSRVRNKINQWVWNTNASNKNGTSKIWQISRFVQRTKHFCRDLVCPSGRVARWPTSPNAKVWTSVEVLFYKKDNKILTVKKCRIEFNIESSVIKSNKERKAQTHDKLRKRHLQKKRKILRN